MLIFYTFCCPKFAQKVGICSKTGLTGNLVLPLKTLNPATIFGRPLFYAKMHHFGAQKTVVLRKIMNIFSVKKAHKNAQFLQWFATGIWHFTRNWTSKLNPKSIKIFMCLCIFYNKFVKKYMIICAFFWSKTCQ